jgi:hypothetical protein
MDMSTDYRIGAFTSLLILKSWLDAHSEFFKNNRVPATDISSVLSVIMSNFEEFMQEQEYFEIKALPSTKKGKTKFQYTKGNEERIKNYGLARL